MVPIRSRVLMPALLITAASLFAFGCGSDDDPTNPGGGGGGGGGDDFDQTTAIAQAQGAGPQAVGMVESIESMANGVGNKNYAYNNQAQRWEYQYDWGTAGYDYMWFYTVQYRDASGSPQESAADAESIHHTLVGTGEYGIDQGGTTIDYDFTYSYDITITGLDTSTYTMTGSGSTGIDYTYSAQGVNQSSDYSMTWATLGSGVMIPQNGCPTGTIRYDMSPYNFDVVFNGSSTATSTLYDGSNNVVAAGGNTHSMGCGRGF